MVPIGRCPMDVIYACGCGLDIHQKTVVACLVTSAKRQAPTKAVRTFRTVTAARWLLADWLEAAGCTHVAMERTGVSWRPVSNLLEGRCTLLVVNAQHIQAVPGRKTEVQDAEWIAARLRHGLLRGRFMPAKPPRQLRELTRHRTPLVQDRARVINRVPAVWEDAHITLASVVPDIRGVSARAMLEALMAGHRDVTALADLARGRLRTQRAPREEAWQG
jgi:transposase